MTANKELEMKIITMQKRIFELMEPLEAEGKVTSDLSKAKDNVIKWQETIEGEFGDDKSYREWPPKQFAHELKKHINIFGNHEGTQLIQEYEELVGKLPYDADREHV